MALTASIIATTTAQAQTYTLNDGEKLTFNSTGPLAASASADNASSLYSSTPPLIPPGDTYTVNQLISVGISLTGNGSFNSAGAGEAGGAGGVVNLITSGYNAVHMTGGGGSGDNGWMAVLPLSPAQVSAGYLVYQQVYLQNTITAREWASTYNSRGATYTGTFQEPGTWVPRGGVGFPTIPLRANQDYFLGNIFTPVATASLNLYTNQNGVSTWFHSGQSAGAPGAPWSTINSLNASLIWSRGVLHLTDNSTDIIVPVPAGWAGSVAIVNIVQQAPNSSDGWYDTVNYMTATVTSNIPPSGTVTPTNTRLLPSQAATISWGVTNGG